MIGHRFILWIGVFWTTTLMATEEPKFEILRADAKIEIRRYAPLIVAETLVDGDMEAPPVPGFAGSPTTSLATTHALP